MIRQYHLLTQRYKVKFVPFVPGVFHTKVNVLFDPTTNVTISPLNDPDIVTDNETTEVS